MDKKMTKEEVVDCIVEAAKLLDEQNVPKHNRIMYVHSSVLTELAEKYPEILKEYYGFVMIKDENGKQIIVKVEERD